MTGREDDPSSPGRRGINERVNDRENRDTSGGRLPPISRGGSRDFPGLSADFRVDILDHEKEVIVVAELPGAEKDAIMISLLNPQTLRITARRTAPAAEGPGGYSIHERGDGTLSRLVRLPASVISEGASTSFKNGVLEVRLTKMRGRPGPGGREIPIT
ncbi:MULTISPECIES: Hsp20/alpha crystallin family protein [unclassified Methanoculleus]|jgi:HSP20 family protein|uniref:Hsp20/alpha crystallin family protein n=1 Tax=unclassified Methanoculleus TaxID=2619537 RepID=UPI0025E70436|nr:Hsp20/alpha crystallin family protein [Methanoculleus sp. UBA303]MCE5339237.1 Hsp20/alpha crystallin family protein [Methanomicrobiaceae archaeon]